MSWEPLANAVGEVGHWFARGGGVFVLVRNVLVLNVGVRARVRIRIRIRVRVRIEVRVRVRVLEFTVLGFRL